MIFLKGKTMKNVQAILKPRAKLRDRLRSAVQGQQALRDGRHKAQCGFTLGELLLVLVIIGVLAVVGFRSVQPIIISGRVQATATDMNSAVQRIISAANAGVSSTSALDYSSITTANIAQMLVSSNMYRVSGTGAGSSVNHRLSTGGSPAVKVIASTTNDLLTIEFDQVHDAACVDVTSLLQAAAVKVVVGTNTVKDVSAGGTTQYDGVKTATSCSAGSSNTLKFTYQ